ncbi:hypothetical protein ACISSW_27670, partial [Escherichia coli]
MMKKILLVAAITGMFVQGVWAKSDQQIRDEAKNNPVSFTHPRAHETLLNLVVGFLFEKTKHFYSYHSVLLSINRYYIYIFFSTHIF